MRLIFLKSRSKLFLGHGLKGSLESFGKDYVVSIESSKTQNSCCGHSATILSGHVPVQRGFVTTVCISGPCADSTIVVTVARAVTAMCRTRRPFQPTAVSFVYNCRVF